MIILFDLIALLIAIVILSIPMYVASKIVVSGRNSSFGKAIAATILTVIILVFLSLGLHVLFAPLAVAGSIIAFLITLFILFYTYSAIYDISLGRSFILAVMEIIMWFLFFLFTGILGAFFALI
ncbi:hypothetical protein ACLIKE_07840 [Ferroplasma acidiphilum]|uniref:Uncharacterized protein n=1 Tax=Ferroplasma acidiphilum TaxID=74969 RepID=A0A7K4FK95_9ARCH|nr:hypothetical protein [Ferroplasma acidiphilum]NOL59345.1 hypothetical protein [Ferroplasma acidiphilum]